MTKPRQELRIHIPICKNLSLLSDFASLHSHVFDILSIVFWKQESEGIGLVFGGLGGVTRLDLSISWPSAAICVSVHPSKQRDRDFAHFSIQRAKAHSALSFRNAEAKQKSHSCLQGVP